MNAQHELTAYYRCPEHLAGVSTAADLSNTQGYFRFDGAVCFGRRRGGEPAKDVGGRLQEVAGLTESGEHGRACVLPFDLSEVATNLRQERYRVNGQPILTRATSSTTASSLYYLLRPMMPVAFRKHLQKVRLSGWGDIPFPRWPLDTTVDELMKRTMATLLRQRGVERLPFVWFWPEGHRSCTMMTHDVEGAEGLAFCDRLMAIDDAHGIKSAFQLIPEGQGDAWRATAELIRQRGFEVNLHDLNHDGRLFSDREEFLERVKRINAHARDISCGGFRSGAMYREQDWYDAFDLEYDMSVPNVAHLEPQRGGCCTVMPYFVGRLLELPLTTTQDYSLFHILEDYSMDLWTRQIELLLAANGLISVITHPDYLVGERERRVYIDLLKHLAALQDRGDTWVALPDEINRWWRQRHAMTLVPDGASWRIEGDGSHRARVAYARLSGATVDYSFDA